MKLIKLAVYDYEIEDVMQKIEENSYSQDRPFDNLFGDEERIVIPLLDKGIKAIVKSLESGETKSGNTYKVDLQKGIVYKDERPMRAGKIIGKELGTISLDRWSDFQDSINKDDNYSIIVSRNPIDILRMSDHDGIASCHSPRRNHNDGDYNVFGCAKQEAISGGFIAYVVHNSSLDEVSLSSPEIFADEERALDGIEPLARIRFNRYIRKRNGDEEIAIPLTITYGNNVSGFYEEIKEWSMESQEEELKNFKMGDWARGGGSYADASDGMVFNKFWGSNDFVGKVPFVGKEDAEELWEEEIDQITQNLEQELDNTGVEATLKHNNNGEIFVKSYAKLSFVWEGTVAKDRLMWDSGRMTSIRGDLVSVVNDYLDEVFEIKSDSDFIDRNFKVSNCHIHKVICPITKRENGININVNFEADHHNPDDFYGFYRDRMPEINGDHQRLEVYLYNYFLRFKGIVNSSIDDSVALIDTESEKFSHFKIVQGDLQKIQDGEEILDYGDHYVAMKCSPIHQNSLLGYIDDPNTGMQIEKPALESQINSMVPDMDGWVKLNYDRESGYYSIRWTINLYDYREHYEAIEGDIKGLHTIEENLPNINGLINNFIKEKISARGGSQIPEPQIQEPQVELPQTEGEGVEASNWYSFYKIAKN